MSEWLSIETNLHLSNLCSSLLMIFICSQTKFVAIILVLWSFKCDFSIDQFLV